MNSKREVVNKLGELWSHFQQIQDNLSQEIFTSQGKLQEIIASLSNCLQLESSLKKLDEILEKKAAVEADKESLLKQGQNLINEDKKNAATIQNILASIDLNFEKLYDGVTAHKVIFNDLLHAYKEFIAKKEQCFECVQEAVSKIESISTPTDSTSTSVAYEKAKQSVEVLNGGKVLLSNMENKAQVIFNRSKNLQNFSTKDISNELSNTKTKWQDAFDFCTQKGQNIESQMVIWRQVEEAKDKLIDWLRNTNQTLTECIRSPADTETALVKIQLYESERHAFMQMYENITEKGKQLAQIYGVESVPNISSLETLLKEEFAVTDGLASQIRNQIGSYTDNENRIREMVKRTNNDISGLRERIVKCDNLTGEIPIIFERLKLCRALKKKLNDHDVCAIESEFNDLLKEYPSFSNSSIGKEISVLQKRYNDISSQANKVENNLLNYLIKFYSEKLSSLNRLVANYKEKIAWCFPELENDKNGLEAKLASLLDLEGGLNECNNNKKELDTSLEMLIAVGCGEEGERFQAEQNLIFSNLDDANVDYTSCHNSLKHLLTLWSEFDQKYEKLSSWLKDIEGKVKSHSATHTDLITISNKLEEFEPLKKQLAKIEPQLADFDLISNNLGEKCDNTRVNHNIQSLKSKHQAVLKSVLSYCERLKSVQQNHEVYRNNLNEAQEWIKNAEKTLDSFKKKLESRITAQNYKELLNDVKAFNDRRDAGHALINNAIKSGEALFVEITPENREDIRNELRNLRDASEHLIDRANSISKTIEGALLKRNSFDDCFSQVVLWVTETENKLNEPFKLHPSLQDKKIALHQFRNILQDIITHETIFKQLEGKAEAFPDEESGGKLDEITSKYNTITKKANDLVSMSEGHVTSHENFLSALEKSRDFLRILINEEAVSDKDGNEGKLVIIENLLTHKDVGETLVKTCEDLLKDVLNETDSLGHDAISSELEEHKDAWRLFLARCNNNVAKLKQLCNKWDKLTNDLDELTNWLKLKEVQVKDQSLKSTRDAKQAHLEKLKALDDEVKQKAEAFTSLVSSSVEADADLVEKVSKLSLRYQSLKNQLKVCLE